MGAGDVQKRAVDRIPFRDHERCQRLELIDPGVKVADGDPSTLQASTGMTIIEVLADSPRNAQQVLQGDDGILSVTQLGVRLRVLIPETQSDPQKLVQQLLTDNGISAEIQSVPASLEDVFVSSTMKSELSK